MREEDANRINDQMAAEAEFWMKNHPSQTGSPQKSIESLNSCNDIHTVCGKTFECCTCHTGRSDTETHHNIERHRRGTEQTSRYLGESRDV